MDYDFLPIPPVIERTEYYQDGANSPTVKTVHMCICSRGTIEHHNVVGFGDEWYEIRCPKCRR